AAAVLAANEALELGFTREELVKFAAEGEAAVAGAPHADNVSASLLGGLVFALDPREGRFLRFEVPPELRVVVLLVEPPDAREKTRKAREALPKAVPLATCVAWLSSAMELAASAARSDWRAFASAVRPDPVVEAAREALYPHVPAVRRAAIEAGALGCALAGAGPSVLALTLEGAGEVAEAMQQASARAGFRPESSLHASTTLAPASSTSRANSAGSLKLISSAALGELNG
ncbi:TPA: hypothetical protein EYP38_05105, partial [Candidatus Micrarchaeota archaeon]|nr:hypothetical protein [Candidatus Micrarchaeota archaeon]